MEFNVCFGEKNLQDNRHVGVTSFYGFSDKKGHLDEEKNTHKEKR